MRRSHRIRIPRLEVVVFSARASLVAAPPPIKGINVELYSRRERRGLLVSQRSLVGGVVPAIHPWSSQSLREGVLSPAAAQIARDVGKRFAARPGGGRRARLRRLFHLRA